MIWGEVMVMDQTMIWDKVDQYIVDCLIRHDPVLEQVLHKNREE